MNEAPLNRRGPNLKVLGKLTDGQPALMKLDKLVSVHTSTGTTEALPLPTGDGDPRLRALDQPRPFLLGHPREDGNKKGSNRPTRVEPGLTDGHDLRADAVEFENIGKVARHLYRPALWA